MIDPMTAAVWHQAEREVFSPEFLDAGGAAVITLAAGIDGGEPNQDDDDLRTSRGVAIAVVLSLILWIVGGLMYWFG
jgi:hypothetical protein